MPDQEFNPLGVNATIVDQSATVSIPTVLFKTGSLISVKFRAWTGTVTLKEADQVIQGVTRADESFFKKGSVMLVPAKELRAFSNRANKFGNFLGEIGREFPIPHARLVSREDLGMINKRCNECLVEYGNLRDEFVAKYPDLRSKRITEFNDRHPEFAGRLDSYFPSAVQISKKFGFLWVIYQVQDIAALNAIEQEEQDNFRSNMKNYVLELARETRQKAVEAAIAFRRSMDRAKATVDSRAVTTFRNFLERFEHMDFTGDTKLRAQLANMKAKAFEMADWSVEDRVSMDAIRAQLDEVVKMGSDEGDIAESARSFVREQTGLDVEFELPAADAVTGLQGDVDFDREEQAEEQGQSPEFGSVSAEELVENSVDRME